MSSKCAICIKAINRDDPKVCCRLCSATSHLRCLGQSELYRSLLKQDSPGFEAENQRKRLFTIHCIPCLRRARKPKDKRLVLAQDEREVKQTPTFLVPVELLSELEESGGKGFAKTPTTHSSEPNSALDKRSPQIAAFDQDTSDQPADKLEVKLQNLVVKDYISVKSLIELREHKQHITFDSETNTYRLLRKIIDEYSSYRCHRCSYPCSFSCSACTSTKGDHLACIEHWNKGLKTLTSGEEQGDETINIEAPEPFRFKCLVCSTERTSLSRKSNRVRSQAHIEPRFVDSGSLDDFQEQPEKKSKRHREEVIVYISRKAPEYLAKEFRRILGQLPKKKLDHRFLYDDEEENLTKTSSGLEGQDVEPIPPQHPMDQESLQKPSFMPHSQIIDEKSQSNTRPFEDYSEQQRVEVQDSNSFTRVVLEVSATKSPATVTASAHALLETACKSRLGDEVEKPGYVCAPVLQNGRRLLVFKKAGSSLGDTKVKSEVVGGVVQRDSRQPDPQFDVHLFPRTAADLELSIRQGLFTRFTDLIEAIENLVAYRSGLLSRTAAHQAYFALMQSSLLQALTQDGLMKKYNQDQLKDLEAITKSSLESEWKIVPSGSPRVPRCCRQFFELSDYEPVVLDSKASPEEIRENRNRVLDRMKSTLGTHCTADCECNKPIHEQGGYLLQETRWDSACINRKDRIECTTHDECDNNRLSQKRFMQLDQDLKLKLCWGIDFPTRVGIFNCLGLGLGSDESRGQFIDDLIKVSNFTDFEGWNLRAICRKMRELVKDENMRQRLQLKTEYWPVCRVLEDLMLYKVARNAFRFYSKGYGVICIKEAGILKNEVITDYLGEIYTPTQWFEKQDAIKSFQKDLKKMHESKAKDPQQLLKYLNTDSVPEFYNIMLEKMPNDDEGYDILYIDPTYKGNYSSRLSHSCRPNCTTVPMVASHKYTIGMFAYENISYGQELTFDYCSVTDNEKESKSAKCLCGHYGCKKTYLLYNKNAIACKRQFTSALTKKYSGQIALLDQSSRCFLDMNANILRASLAPLTPEERSILQAHYFRDSILKNAPEWLKKWTAITLAAIDKELQSIERANESHSTSNQDSISSYNRELNSQLGKDHYNERRWNLIYTLDKIQAFLAKNEIMKRKQESTMIDEGQDSKSHQPYHSRRLKKQVVDRTEPHHILSLSIPKENKADSCSESERTVEASQVEDSTPFVLIPEARDEEHYWVRVKGSKETNLSQEFEMFSNGLIDSATEEQRRELVTISGLLKVQSAKELAAQMRSLLAKDGDIEAELLRTAFPETVSQSQRKYIYRRALLVLAHRLKATKHPKLHQAVPDLFIFHAFCRFLFMGRKFSPVTQNVEIRECDLTHFNKYLENSDLKIKDEEKVVYNVQKSYPAFYMWAQLVFWMKQTIERPDASLSQGRRGTLNLPNMEASFYRFLKPTENSSSSASVAKKKNSAGGSMLFPYNVAKALLQNRKNWHDHIQQKPGDSWPIGDDWSYDKSHKIWGTMLLDSILLEPVWPTMRKDILGNLESPLSKLLELHLKYEEQAESLLKQLTNR